MCEQTEVSYLDGDVVWVKLGPCWWPGEVCDKAKLPTEILKDFRKEPIAIVKFFQEDQYEYVKNINHIYKYNCRRKSDFIKKGLDMFRAKNTFMDKFPGDVCHAESITGGDPDIITRDEFIPDKKPSYSDIFGTPTPKKSPKSGRGRPSLSGIPKSGGPKIVTTPRITHPRFTGKSDHEVRILEQSTPPSATTQYCCHICGFESTRLNVIVLHTRSHSNGTYVSPSKSKKKSSSPKKQKRPKSFATTNSIDEDLELIRQGAVLTTEESTDSEAEPVKEIKKSSGGKRKGQKNTASVSKKAKMSSICNNLLADWGDEEEEDNEADTSITEIESDKDKQEIDNIEETASKTPDKNKSSKSPEKITKGSEDEVRRVASPNRENKSKASSSLLADWNEDAAEKDEKTDKASCFDFEDEEETPNTILEKSPGRKIPRVIPPKRISKDTLEDDKMDVDNDVNKDKKDDNDPDLEAFKNILEETSVPKITNIPEIVDKTSNTSKKSPEKKIDDSTSDKTNGVLKKSDTKEESAITQAPKKRIVRNFEEFENSLQDQIEDSTDLSSNSSLEVSKLKTQLMNKLSPVKQSPEHKAEDEKKFFLRRTRSSRSDSEKIAEIPELIGKRKKKNETVTPKKSDVESTENVQKKQFFRKEPLEKLTDNKTEQEKKPKTRTASVSTSKSEETFSTETQNFPTEPEKSETDSIKVKKIEDKLQESSENLIDDTINFQKNLADITDICTEETNEIELSVPRETAQNTEISTKNDIVIQKKEFVQNQPFQKGITISERDNSKTAKNKVKGSPKKSQEDPSKSQKMIDIAEICIDNSDNMSGLSTLAAVSELSGNLETTTQDSEVSKDENKTESETKDDTSQQKSVKTLANFSMDFCDSSTDSTTIIVTDKTELFEKSESTTVHHVEPRKSSRLSKLSVEREIKSTKHTSKEKLNSYSETTMKSPKKSENAESVESSIPEPKLSTNILHKKLTEPLTTEPTLESEIAKLTDTKPGAENIMQEQQNTSSSKLLEILTEDPNSQKSVLLPSQKVQMLITDPKLSKKFDPKNSKFVIKSSTPPNKMVPKSNKPIILSEKIIRPMSETENVSVKKVTSKRTYEDVEDIDTFIIQKPTKKTSIADSSKTDFSQEIILTTKSENIKNLKSVTARGGSVRGKPKIIEQTIIKAADVQTATSSASSEGQQTILDDSMFDINSMPIVLSDQILTPESIENMPVVMTNIMSASSSSLSSSTSSIQTMSDKSQTVLTKRGGPMKIIGKEKVSVPSNTTSQSDTSKPSQNVVVKNIMPRGLGKNQKVYQTGSKILKNNPAVITQAGKPGKFIILPSSQPSSTTTSRYTVGKRTAAKNVQPTPTTSKLKPVQQSSEQPTGNKIMIVTNQHGVQSRVLLTPAQQKMLGCKMPTTKITKSTTPGQVKGTVMQKSVLTSKGTIISPMNSKPNTALASQTLVTSKGQIYSTQPNTIITSEGQILSPVTQIKSFKQDPKGKKQPQLSHSRFIIADKSAESSQKSKMNMLTKTKTILIKGAQGQTIKKIQSPVTETTKNVLISPTTHKSSQLISLSGQHVHGTGKQVVVTSKGQLIKADNKLITKQAAEKIRMQTTKAPVPQRIVSKTTKSQIIHNKLPSSSSVPPLAPITAAQRKEIPPHILKQQESKLATLEKTVVDTTPKDQKIVPQQEQPGSSNLNLSEQILAIPSGEGADGQASYILVTVDEAGNCIPLSNEALMSFGSNIVVGDDMANLVLVDSGQENQEVKPAETTTEMVAPNQLIDNQQHQIQMETIPQQTIEATNQQQIQLGVENQLVITDDNVLPIASTAETQLLVSGTGEQIIEHQPETTFMTDENQIVSTDNLIPENQTAVACSINNGDTSQQLIITGDPESTQKFLASLTDGNTDLSSLLAGTDGNIIINADGQQILLNTDSENQILLSVNSNNLGLIQTSEVDTNQFVNQTKNQDILAAALADTDVFQQDTVEKSMSNQTISKASTSAQSQLSPNSAMYPMNVGNVLETSLTLGSPIMTPLEVPSVNNKKISEVDSALITQVPSSLELPITITDPSISQTVSQQVMLGNELQTNLELPITMSESGISSIRSTEMSSPNFVYSLPSLDENSDLEQHKRFTESTTVITTDIYNTSLTGSMSMPLLTEEPEMPPDASTATTDSEITNETQILSQETTQAHEKEDKLQTQTEITKQESIVPETEISEKLTQETEKQTQKIINESDIPAQETEVHEIPTEIASQSIELLSNQQTPIESTSVKNDDNLKPREKIPGSLQIGPIDEELDLSHSDICSSLSEPPPGMFDKSFSSLLNKASELENATEMMSNESETNNLSNLLSENSDNNQQNSNVNAACQSNEEKILQDFEMDQPDGGIITQDVPRTISETPNSDLNSPRLDIDENSEEIPIQPQIITNLGESFEENSCTTNDFNSFDENKMLHDNNDEARTETSCD